ncbi:hypothetical protein [Micromonospora auratinigra]|uniref:Peptidase inhibitor family I36 n=1 Tax=Micromonospora auratinigra TaxID=261654 RepID=A0A1A9A3I3_9ACTN|nr:hypothetical protein [Micromonospora auratinigra]SBT51009.1 hypothetical protein GA0070611_4983 [Micromonospora auratinigra]
MDSASSGATRMAAVALAATAVLGIAAEPVSASSSVAAGTGGTTLTTYYPPTNCSTSWNFTDRWGRRGTFKCSSHVMLINWWGSGRLEYFGVAPNRTIWHSWSTSGWVEMPNNGRADDVDGVQTPNSTTRSVWVYAAGSGVWSSTDYGDGYSWRAWKFLF